MTKLFDKEFKFSAPIVGDKLYFNGEKKPYKIRARNRRFIICTKPFNLRRTVLYTILDLQERIRGTENLVFCRGFETDQQCEEALVILTLGQSRVSRRNFVPLDIDNIY